MGNCFSKSPTVDEEHNNGNTSTHGGKSPHDTLITIQEGKHRKKTPIPIDIIGAADMNCYIGVCDGKGRHFLPWISKKDHQKFLKSVSGEAIDKEDIRYILPRVSDVDMAHFVNLTSNGVIIVGNTTYKAVCDKYRLTEPANPFKGRRVIVLSRGLTEYTSGNIDVVTYCNDIETSVDIASRFILDNAKIKIYVIGGKTIYHEFINQYGKRPIIDPANQYSPAAYIDKIHWTTFLHRAVVLPNGCKPISFDIFNVVKSHKYKKIDSQYFIDGIMETYIT